MVEIIAYLDDNKKWGKKDIPVQKLTCINYAFAKIADCRLVGDLKKISLINELKAMHPHLKTCISIGGWGADGFSDAVSSAKKRTVFIKSTLDFVQKYAFDGVDLDWEYPGMSVADIQSDPADAKNFLAFVKELRENLTTLSEKTQKNYRVTAAIGAAKEFLDTMSPNEMFAYIDYLDYVNVMTYDMRGSFTKTPGHHTNLYAYEKNELSCDQAVTYLLKKGIAPQKIVIGGAWYARKWTGFSEKVKNPFQTKAQNFGTQTVDHNDLKKILQNHLEYQKWDEQAKAAYYFDGGQFLTYDDVHSVKAKAEYIKKHQLRGFMYWEHSLDLSNKLVTAVYETLKTATEQ